MRRAPRSQTSTARGGGALLRTGDTVAEAGSSEEDLVGRLQGELARLKAAAAESRKRESLMMFRLACRQQVCASCFPFRGLQSARPQRQDSPEPRARGAQELQELQARAQEQGESLSLPEHSQARCPCSLTCSLARLILRRECALRCCRPGLAVRAVAHAVASPPRRSVR